MFLLHFYPIDCGLEVYCILIKLLEYIPLSPVLFSMYSLLSEFALIVRFPTAPVVPFNGPVVVTTFAPELPEKELPEELSSVQCPKLPTLK